MWGRGSSLRVYIPTRQRRDSTGRLAKIYTLWGFVCAYFWQTRARGPDPSSVEEKTAPWIVHEGGGGGQGAYIWTPSPRAVEGAYPEMEGRGLRQ